MPGNLVDSGLTPNPGSSGGGTWAAAPVTTPAKAKAPVAKTTTKKATSTAVAKVAPTSTAAHVAAVQEATAPNFSAIAPASPNTTAANVGGVATPIADPAPIGTVSQSAAAVPSTLPPAGSALAPYGVTGTTDTTGGDTSGSTAATSGLSITDIAIIGGTLIALLVAIRTKGKGK